ncbi:YceG-like family protein [compost metagenome]
MTKEQLVKEAAKLNMTVADKTSAEPSAQGDNAAKDNEGAVQESAGKDAPASPKPSASPVVPPKAAIKPGTASAPASPSVPSSPVSVEVAKPKTTTTSVSPPATPKAADSGTVSVRIPTGINLAETAELLSKAGIIDDKAKFLQAADSRRANKIIQYGSYNFTKGESINSIIDKLVTVK